MEDEGEPGEGSRPYRRTVGKAASAAIDMEKRMTILLRLPLATASVALLIATAAPTPAAAQQTRRAALREACKGDYQQLCSTVQPGGGRILKCLRDQSDKLSEGCKTALAQRKN